MQFTRCASCNNSIPVNDSLAVDGATYCESCLKTNFPDEASLKNRQITKEFDPTICVRCQNDNGEMPHQKLGEYPMCRNCLSKHTSTILPRWVKAFFIGVLLLVLVSFIWNLRFIRGYYLAQKIDQIVAEGDFDAASESLTMLAENVPEVREFRSLAAYYTGISLLGQNKSQEALESFRKCSALGMESDVDFFITQAEIGVAADNRDFRTFVVAARKMLLYDTTATSYAQVASAYSCLYGVERKDSLADLSREYLMKARLKNDTSHAFRYYASMIEYRLATGNPISREEYMKLFPITAEQD